jgi:hypothetical protein
VAWPGRSEQEARGGGRNCDGWRGTAGGGSRSDKR